jgi:hypothetical protein
LLQAYYRLCISPSPPPFSSCPLSSLQLSLPCVCVCGGGGVCMSIRMLGGCVFEHPLPSLKYTQLHRFMFLEESRHSARCFSRATASLFYLVRLMLKSCTAVNRAYERGWAIGQAPPQHPSMEQSTPQVESHIERRRRLGRERQQRFRNRKRLQSAQQAGMRATAAPSMAAPMATHPAMATMSLAAFNSIAQGHVQPQAYDSFAPGSIEDQAVFQMKEIFLNATQV